MSSSTRRPGWGPVEDYGATALLDPGGTFFAATGAFSGVPFSPA